MSTATADTMDYQPDDVEREVLGVIRSEGRVNPLRVREQTDVRKQYVNDAFGQLQKLGVVRKVNRGLYEYVPEADSLPGAPDVSDPADERVAELEDEISRLREQLADARNGAGVDVDRVCASVETALRALDERQPSVDLARSELETALEECGRE